MRGYQVLKRSGRLDRIAAVKEALTEHSLGLPQSNFSSVVMGAGAASGEIVLRQNLLVRVGGDRLNRALLLALGKEQGRVLLPLPKEWREILTKHGFEVAYFWSALLWQCYVCALLLYGAAKIGKITINGITSRKRAETNRKSYVYFADLGLGNLPQKTNNSQSHDVVSWYLQWPGRKSDIETVRHSVANSSPSIVDGIAVLPQCGALPVLTGWGAIINYAVWGLHASVISALDCLRGRWWHALLLYQAALSAQARALPTEFLAREYLFHNSGWIYRPLWTYEAERRGAVITFYFYSSNSERFKRSDGYPPLPYGWKAMTWSRYLVWDEYHADFVRRGVGEGANISIVGPIWFHAGGDELPAVNTKGVAVFDITPFRSSKYQTFGADFEFYVPSTSIRFLTDIQEVAEDAGYMMLWKGKRKIASIAHPKYRYLARRLSETESVITVDSDISAHLVIEASTLVISMPFTSTALIARELGKPSCYYDPTALLQKDDRAAHGIPIIQGPQSLRAWINEQAT